MTTASYAIHLTILLIFPKITRKKSVKSNTILIGYMKTSPTQSLFTGLHHNTDPEDISRKLSTTGHQVINVINIHIKKKLDNKTSHVKLLLFKVDLKFADNNSVIFDIRTLCDCIVSIELPKKNANVLGVKILDILRTIVLKCRNVQNVVIDMSFENANHLKQLLLNVQTVRAQILRAIKAALTISLKPY